MNKQSKKETVPFSKTREWLKQRNERRRRVYRENKARRLAVNLQNRRSYRRNNIVESNKALPPSKLSSVAVNRTVPTLGCIPTLSVADMGIALGGYHKVVVYRWISQNKFPKPKYSSDEGLGVYTLNQAKKIVEVFYAHQKTSAHFCFSHKDTIEKLFKCLQ